MLVEVINRLLLQLRKLLHSLTVGRCTLTNSDTQKLLDIFTVFLLIRHLQCSKKKRSKDQEKYDCVVIRMRLYGTSNI